MAESGSRARLDRQPSRLDLIDNSTLTSLPFAPPLKTSKKSRSQLGNRSKSTPNIQHASSDYSLGSTRRSVPRETIPRELPKDFLSRDIPIEDVSFTSIDTLTTQNMTTEIDESFEDNEEPIILVEDYMTMNGNNSPVVDSRSDKHFTNYPNPDSNIHKPPTSLMNPRIKAHQLFRQKSLATFKQRLSVNNRSKRKISGESNGTENLEEIFGDLPGKDQLKHCDICDKPLYEISSVISNKRAKVHNSNDIKNPQLNDIFNEFICFDCIEIYEEFLHELYNNELNNEEIDGNSIMNNSINDYPHSLSTGLPELKNLKLLNMFKTIQLRSMRSIPSNLMDQLKFLNSNTIIQSNGMSELNWLKTLQNKLRWRWRLNGLLPSFMKPSSDVNRN